MVRTLTVDGIGVAVCWWWGTTWPCHVFIDYQPYVRLDADGKVEKGCFDKSDTVTDKVVAYLRSFGFTVEEERFKAIVSPGTWKGSPRLVLHTR